MARNGSGTMSLAKPPFIDGTFAIAGDVNADFSDIANEITNSIPRDGQAPPTANLPMGGLRHTNVGNATVRTEYISAGQVEDGVARRLTSVSGSNAITASIAPAIAAYVSGQRFSFIVAVTNTAAVTMAISGLSAVPVTKFGTVPLANGDLPAGTVAVIEHDGTQFQLTTLPVGSRLRLIDEQVFTASATWTRPAGAVAALTDGMGGGGAGGGTTATVSGQHGAGGGGGAGAYAQELILSGLAATETVTVGAGGLGSTGANGGAGGASSFGAHWTAGGGAGGTFGTNTSSAASQVTQPGAGGAASGVVLGSVGSAGEPSMAISNGTTSVLVVSGRGANTPFGSGGVMVQNNNNGIVGAGHGSGGSGSANFGVAGAQIGGDGRLGFVRVRSYGL